MRPGKPLLNVLSIILVTVLTLSFGWMAEDEVHKVQVAEQAIEINTDGLYYAEFYDYIFRGHFENIEFTREDVQFLMIFEQYLRAFGRQCPDDLPADKVEIMEPVCARYEVTTNGFGVETNRTCIDWTMVGTGLFARPDLYKAKLMVERIQSTEVIGKALAMLADPNALGNSVDMRHKAKGLMNDMARIFQLNQCDSDGVRRFEENLKLFALNKPSIRMKEESKYTTVKKSGGPTGQQNFGKLVDHLVADQAKTWSFNRYVSGSISNIIMVSKDSQGRPNEIKASYQYKGFGSSDGSVRVTFKNGLPDCIYFFDFPNNCKAPNNNIIISYARGDYTR